LQVLIVPAAKSESTCYEDDGQTLNYRQGVFLKRRFRQSSNQNSITIDVGTPEGTYRPNPRDLILETWLDREPQSVSMGTGESADNPATLPYLDAKALADSNWGWSFEDGLLTVKSNDGFTAERFIIQR
jgi:hypothetical protein